MKYIIIILFFILTTNSISGQIKAVCDDVREFPRNIEFSFFVISDNIQGNLLNFQRFDLNIRADSLNGDILLRQSVQSNPIVNSGFVTIKLSVFSSPVYSLLEFVNSNPEREYFVELLHSNKRIGAKKITTVPYAMVSSPIGGLGPAGPEGPQGPDGNPGCLLYTSPSPRDS